MPGGNIQEGFLGAGAGVGGPELVSRTDRFDSEGGRTGIPGRRISPTTHCASPPLPTGPEPAHLDTDGHPLPYSGVFRLPSMGTPPFPGRGNLCHIQGRTAWGRGA